MLRVIHGWAWALREKHVDLFRGLTPTRYQGRRYWVVETSYDQLEELLVAVYDVVLVARTDRTRPDAPKPKVEPPRPDVEFVEAWHEAMFYEIRSVQNGDPVTLIGKCATLLVAPEEPGCSWRQTRSSA